MKQNNFNNNQVILLDYIFKNAIFLKSTSRHISKGILFYKNFKFFNRDLTKHELENIKIYNKILNFFN